MAKTFGALLREKRKAAGYTLASLAGLLDSTPARISAIERGLEAPLDRTEIARVAKLLGVDPAPLRQAASAELAREFRSQWPI